MSDVPSKSGVYSVYRPESLAEHYATDEDALIAGLVANVPAAWRQFQKNYDRLIHRCITKVTRRFSSVVSADDVREIYGALYLQLLGNDRHKLRSFDKTRGNRFSSWIGLLAINCAYDYLRTLRREPHKVELMESHELVTSVPDAFEVLSERQHAAIATRMLEEFSEKDRTFATLYFGEQLDPNEIAERMQISVKTVYSKKHKLQCRLEAELAKSKVAA